MKPILSAIALLALGVILVAEAGAGPRRGIVTPRAGSGVRSFSGGVPGRAVVQRHFFYSGYPYYYQHYYQPYYPPVLVNERYFCVLHNQGFISRVGLLDHLAGTDKVPLEAATRLCPDTGGSCVFPSY